jgi:hypothetical protein
MFVSKAAQIPINGVVSRGRCNTGINVLWAALTVQAKHL